MEEKTLIIIRHAKSSWADYGCPDFDRALNKRGLRDAPFMAKKLKELSGFTPDLIITSPAKRAKTTAQYFHEEFGLSKEQFREDQKLYHASTTMLINVIRKAPDNVDTLAITAHNPGLTNFANEFPRFSIDNLPTSGIVVIKLNIPTWQSFNFEKGVVTSFLYPKKYLHA